MLKNRNLIIFGDDWDRYPTTMQHTGKILAKYNRILWIGSLGLRKPQIGWYDLYRFFEKGMKFLSRKKKNAKSANVWELHPLIIPFHDHALIRKFNLWSLRYFLKKTIAELNFENPILITSTPLVANLLGTLGETSSHYICLDDYSLFDRAFLSLRELEQQLLEKVDSSFSVSDILVQARVPKSGEAHFLPQGVDTDHFMPSADTLPPNIASVKKPIVGFFGILTTWVDIDLVIRCARRYPNVSFVLLGRSTIDLTNVSMTSNMVHLGEVPYSELPRYANNFDVGLIPFHVNSLTVAANPLKLLEYLSLGLPVVSTCLPEVEKFRDEVFIARDNEHFMQLIDVALQDNTPERNHRRRARAEQFSWMTIVENISDTINRIESFKPGYRNKLERTYN